MSREFNYEGQCDWCTNDIEEYEYKENGGLCHDCIRYLNKNSNLTKKDDTKVVYMCENYLACGKESVCHGDYGHLCIDCWMKDVKGDKSVVKKVVLSKKEQKRKHDSIINGLRSVLAIK